MGGTGQQGGAAPETRWRGLGGSEERSSRRPTYVYGSAQAVHSGGPCQTVQPDRGRQ